MVKGSLLLQFLLTAHFPSVIYAEWISIYGHSWTRLVVKRELAFCDSCIENILQSNDFWKSEFSTLIYTKMHIHPHICAHTRVYVIFTTAPFYSILNYDSMYWDISETPQSHFGLVYLSLFLQGNCSKWNDCYCPSHLLFLKLISQWTITKNCHQTLQLSKVPFSCICKDQKR